MRIGVDIDGVIFPWADVANEVLVARFAIPDPGPHTSWDHLIQAVTVTRWSWLWSAEGQNAVFSQVGRTYPGIVEVVNTLLKDGHELHFVTHRDPRRTAVLTATFLALHFGRHPWAGVHVVRNSVKKHELADWDVFIDDKPETVWAFLEQERARVFAPARPWNTELADSLSLVRYEDPREILEALA